MRKLLFSHLPKSKKSLLSTANIQTSDREQAMRGREEYKINRGTLKYRKEIF